MPEEPRRLTAVEVKNWERRFQNFMTPAAMLALEAQLADIVGEYFFLQTGLQFAREAHVAGHVGRLRKAARVRLVPKTRPDCEMIVRGRLERFEITEADLPGRRRGDEYRETIERPIDDPVEAVLARAKLAPRMLQTASERKARGDYAPDCGLIIYLNLSEYDWCRREIETAMPEAINSARETFKTVIVLWKDRLFPFRGLKAAGPGRAGEAPALATEVV
jgi:hypothetical protein